MSQTLLGKLKLLVTASLNSIVDQALQANSLSVFDEYIRQAEASMDTLDETMVALLGTVKTLKRKYDEAANEAAQLDMQVDEALKAGKTLVAKTIQLHLNQHLQVAETYKDQYDKQSSTYTMLKDIRETLQAKVEMLDSQRDQVATLLQLVQSKQIVAKSIKDVQSIADDRAGQIVEKVRTQLDTADARLEVATNRLSTQMDAEIGDADLNAQLEARRAKLGLS